MNFQTIYSPFCCFCEIIIRFQNKILSSKNVLVLVICGRSCNSVSFVTMPNARSTVFPKTVLHRFVCHFSHKTFHCFKHTIFFPSSSVQFIVYAFCSQNSPWIRCKYREKKSESCCALEFMMHII